MRADYDSSANAISIAITEPTDRSDEVYARAIVALADGQPVECRCFTREMGVSEPLAAVAGLYGLDREAAAHSALATPGRLVSLEVTSRPTA